MIWADEGIRRLSIEAASFMHIRIKSRLNLTDVPLRRRRTLICGPTVQPQPWWSHRSAFTWETQTCLWSSRFRSTSCLWKSRYRGLMWRVTRRSRSGHETAWKNGVDLRHAEGIWTRLLSLQWCLPTKEWFWLICRSADRTCRIVALLNMGCLN